MTSTQGLDIKKGQYAGRFVKLEARNVSYELVSVTAPLVVGTKRVARMGRGLTFDDLAKDTGCYRGHGPRKGDLDESDNEFVEGGMTERAYYRCKLTFGGDNRARGRLSPFKKYLTNKDR